MQPDDRGAERRPQARLRHRRRSRPVAAAAGELSTNLHGRPASRCGRRRRRFPDEPGPGDADVRWRGHSPVLHVFPEGAGRASGLPRTRRARRRVRPPLVEPRDALQRDDRIRLAAPRSRPRPGCVRPAHPAGVGGEGVPRDLDARRLHAGLRRSREADGVGGPVPAQARPAPWGAGCWPTNASTCSAGTASLFARRSESMSTIGRSRERAGGSRRVGLDRQLCDDLRAGPRR